MIIAQIGKGRVGVAAIAVLIIAGCFWLGWLCERNPDIAYLAGHPGAEWVIYPKPPDAQVCKDFEIVTVFRRGIHLEKKPEQATLHLRAFKRFEVNVNGVSVRPEAPETTNWKDESLLEVSAMLQPGTNEIVITVFNRKAPPALWAYLDAGQSEQFASGPGWEASIMGAAWQPAWPAAVPMPLAKGNQLLGGENTAASLRQTFPKMFGFAIIAGLIVAAVSKYLPRYALKRGQSREMAASRLMIGMVAALGLLWMVLFANNLRFLPARTGYDERAHEQYINYIRTEKALPLAPQGWEMCQPPLYYLIGAGIESVAGAAMGSERAIALLRVFGLAAGVVHFVLIFLCLRLVFPRQTGAQWFGLLLAALIPEHLYIAQYVTNEFLAATFVTGALYACLRLIKGQFESWKLALATGLCLGAALLTKFTPILAAPFIFGALGWRISSKSKEDLRARTRTLAIVLAAAFVVAGWHYVRVWIYLGTPVVHDWDAVSGFSWWTDRGFQTAGFLGRFGESLVRPYYSVFHGFFDGVYSSMWGDALYGGIGSWANRPAWDYQLMTAGFLWSLLPSLVILTGFLVCAGRFLRRPDPVWFLLLGLAVTAYAALFYMSLKLPFYCNVKAFYALFTLMPMCAFGAAGWAVLTQLAGRLQPVLYIAMLVWAMNACASFWIRGGDSATHTMRGSYFSAAGRFPEAISELDTALRINPHDLLARELLGMARANSRDLPGAWEETKLLLADDPDSPSGLVQKSIVLSSQGRLEPALETVQRAARVAPDFELAYGTAGVYAAQLGKYGEAAGFFEEGLRVEPFNADRHMQTAASLIALGRMEDANRHFAFACLIKQAWTEPEARDRLGLALMEQKIWDAAIREFSDASHLQPSIPGFFLHRAQAYLQTGRFDEAVADASQAIELAQANNDGATLAASRKVIAESQARSQPRQDQPANGNPPP